MQHIKNDGGRAMAGYKGKTGDCGCRAIAIATGLPYQEVYDRLNELAKSERITKRKRTRSNARTGLWKNTAHRFFKEIGWVWTPTMTIGSGCKIHLRSDELPKGRLVVALSKHYAAVIDGVLHDAYDSSRNGTRCVYGYWQPDDARAWQRVVDIRAGKSKRGPVLMEQLLGKLLG